LRIDIDIIQALTCGLILVGKSFVETEDFLSSGPPANTTSAAAIGNNIVQINPEASGLLHNGSNSRRKVSAGVITSKPGGSFEDRNRE
jgi:hypothetical protein